MKVSDKAIVFGVLVAALAIGFYLMVLSPKREKASELNEQIDQLHALDLAAGAGRQLR